jgi:hypothetical protein
MPAFRKQHYLPAAYLKYFSVDQNHCARDSKVWRFDGSEQRLTRVENECFENFGYSRQRPAEAESLFHASESAYCKCLDMIRSGPEPSGAPLGDLLLFMFDVFIRNRVHENMTGEEGIEAYKRRTEIFLGNIFGADNGMSIQEIGRLISNNWRVKVLDSHPNSIFLTSDHPSIWMSLNRVKPVLHLVILPLTPHHMAVAFDRNVLQIVSFQATDRDCLLTNIFQTRQAVQSIYAPRALTGTELEVIRKEWKRRFDTQSAVTENAWSFSLPSLPPECYFSFMRSMPPVL